MRQVSLKQSQYVIYVAAAVEFVRSVKLALALVAARPLSNDRSVGKWRSATRCERAWTAADLNMSVGTRGATAGSLAENALIQMSRSPKARDSSNFAPAGFADANDAKETARVRLSIHVGFVTKMSETGP